MPTVKTGIAHGATRTIMSSTFMGLISAECDQEEFAHSSC
jgi:hypothetical protein